MYNYQPSGYNGYNPYMPQQNFQPQQYQPQIQVPSGISGKVVESIDIVKATEIPFNGTSVFPQTDGSVIYTKQYMNDGRTKIDTYKKVSEESEASSISMDQLYSSIQELSAKVDALQKPTPKKKVVEVVEDDE